MKQLPWKLSMGQHQAFKANWKSDITATYHVLNFKFCKLCLWKYHKPVSLTKQITGPSLGAINYLTPIVREYAWWTCDVVGELVCYWDHWTMEQQVCYRCESLKATRDSPELDPFVSEAWLVLILLLIRWLRWANFSSQSHTTVMLNLRNFVLISILRQVKTALNR